MAVVAGTAVEPGQLVVGGGGAALQEDEPVLQVVTYPLTALGERSITVSYAGQRLTGSTGPWSSPSTVQDSAPESRIHMLA